MKFLGGLSKEQNEKLKKTAHETKTILDSIPNDSKTYTMAKALGLGYLIK